MLRKHLLFILIFSNCFCYGQWKSFYPEKKQNKKNTKVTEKLEKDQLNKSNLFFNALKQKSLENYKHAISLFEKCIEKEPDFIEAYYQISLIKKQLNLIFEAKEYSSKTIENNTSNIWYLRNHAEILFLNQEYLKSAKIYDQIIQLEPNNEFNYYKLADTYIYSENYLKAINVYNDLEQKRGIDKMVSMQKHKLYLQTKNFNKATKTLEKLSENFPDDVEVLQILAEAYILANQQDKALEIFKKISILDPNNGQVNLTLANFYRDKGQLNKSYIELQNAFRSLKINIETKLTILASYLAIINANDTIKSQAFELINILDSLYVDNAELYALWGDMYYATNEKSLSLKYYKRSIKIKQSIKPVWTQILFIDVEQANYDSLLIYSEKAILYYPTEPLYYYFYGVSNSFFKNHLEAKNSLESGIEYVFDNESLYNEFQTSLADTYNALSLYHKSDSLYEQVLYKNPNNAIVLNNYSYYLSLRKFNLEKAQKMSYKCNELEPNNGTYQDTYAWILYCLEDYDNARLWIEKALKNGGDKSAVIIEHYGDILFKLGEKKEAIDQWKKAKLIDSGSELLDKKIKNEDLFE